jgi:hypothetical protein
MKELLEKIITFIPEYLMGFGKLLARPKTFLAKARPNTKSGFRSGLQFLAISLVLSVISLTPLLPEGSDIWKNLAITSLYELLAVAALACITRLAWLIVGGRASTRSLLTLYSYVASVVLVLSAVTLIIADGTARVFNPALHAAIKQAQLAHQPIPAQFSKAYLAAAGIWICGFIVLTVWFVASWGAFRALNRTTRGRSVLAFILTNVFSVPVTFVMFLISSALNP